MDFFIAVPAINFSCRYMDCHDALELPSSGDFRSKTITFWQAMGILILSKILFGGFHFGKGVRDFKERKMREKMAGLSPEEREKFKEVWRNKCSGGFFNRNNE